MATVPGPPFPVTLSEITYTGMTTVFVGNSSGGSPVLEWQIGYGTNPTTAQIFAASSGTLDVTGLTPGVKYYFWARGRNAIGWGAWSTVSSATTVPGVRIKVGAVWKNTAVPYVRVNGVWKVARAWGRVAGTWRENL